MGMILRRLTKIEKKQILEDFRSGISSNELAEKYNCTSNTINRTVKNQLSNEEYHLLKETRSKSIIPKLKKKENKLFNKERELFGVDESHSKCSLDPKNDKNYLRDVINNEVDKLIESDKKYSPTSLPIDSNNIGIDSESDKNLAENNFEEIVPLISSFGFDTKEQIADCKNLDKVSLPESLYMLIDKKVELEPQPISELSEWSFLPESELKRQAILLFSNKRSASRNCARNQRILKIPNTDVFRISKSYLLKKGITRLIIEDSLISLEN